LVELTDVKKYFPLAKAVDGVSLAVAKDSTYGLVGESGSGKTTLGKIILGVIRPDAGEVKVSASRLQAVFQDPATSLDPKMRVRDIIAEPLILKGERPGRARLEEALGLVRLPMTSLSKHPHEFSGGERQRIAIARAVIGRPDFIVCDEPVSSLDMDVQQEILELLKNLKARFGMTLFFISHDLKVIRSICDRVAVMKDGRIVEEGETAAVYEKPRHPYTKRLVKAAFLPRTFKGSGIDTAV